MTQQYQIRTELNVPYEEAIERTTAALKDEGFGVLTEIDVKATLKKKLDTEFRKYVILGACNPSLAHRGLQAELELGLLLPCNVIVYETDAGDSVVSIVDPTLIVDAVGNSDLQPIADEATARLRRVVQKLEGEPVPA